MHAVSADPIRDDAQSDEVDRDRHAADIAVDSERLPPLSPGQLVADRYSIERILASGGMGVVWLGRHEELEQPVAIKFLRRSFCDNPAVVARFLDEARAAAALRGEHVVRVVDVGQLPSGVPYFVMEYLEGTDLETLVRREGPLPIERAVDYVLQACEGLSEAHRAGIVHRDVKPENLFLIRGQGHKSIVKVVDFGIAKRLDTTRAKVVTGPQDNMGSPCYMSPEQMASPRAIDARTDIWSLGVVLYQLLTGQLPFDGDTLTEVFARVANAVVRPLFEVRADVDSHLDAIVRRCLAKDPDARFQSVEALREALWNYQAGALSRTAPSLEAIPLSTRSDAPVALIRTHGSSSRAGFVAALLAVGTLGVGAAVVAQNDASLVRQIVSTIHQPQLGALAEEAATREELARRDFGPYLVGPLGDVSKDGEVGAEPELDLGDYDDESEDQPKPKAAPHPRVIKAEDASIEDTEAHAARVLRRERAYDAYLAKHGWRPLNDVLRELKGSANVSTAPSDGTGVAPVSPSAPDVAPSSTATSAPNDTVAPAPSAPLPQTSPPAASGEPDDLKPP